MKIVITGHTSGLGKAIYDHYKHDHTVIGLSRGNGYDIRSNDAIVNVASTADIFFNNAYCGVEQANLIDDLLDKTMIVTSGSMGADYAHIDNTYFRDKHAIEQQHKLAKKISRLTMLLLKMGYLENYVDKKPVAYSTVLRAIDLWIQEPRISMIEFENINY